MIKLVLLCLLSLNASCFIQAQSDFAKELRLAAKNHKAQDSLSAWLGTFQESYNHLKKQQEYGIASANFDSALLLMWRQPQKTDEWHALGKTYLLSGWCHAKLNRYDLQAKKLEKAREIYDSLPPLKKDASTVLRYVYKNLGDAYCRIGETDAGEQVLLSALQKPLAQRDNDIRAQLFSSLGLIYREKKVYALEMEAYLKAKSLSNLSAKRLTVLNDNISKALIKEGQYDAALEVAAESLALCDQTLTEGGKSRLDTLNYYHNKASLYLGIGNIHSSLSQKESTNGYPSQQNKILAGDFLKKGISHIQLYTDQPDRRKSKFYLSYSQFLLTASELDSALYYAQLALKQILPSLPILGNEYSDPSTDLFYPENVIKESLLQKANVYVRMNEFDKALKNYELYFLAAEVLNQGNFFESSNLNYSDEIHATAVEAIEAIFALKDNSNNLNLQHKNLFTNFAAAARHNTIKRSLQRIKLAHLNNVPDSILQEEKKAHTTFNALKRQRLSEKINETEYLAKAERIQERIKNAEDRINRFLPYKIQNNPNLSKIDLGELSRNLAKSQSILQYTIVDSTVYISHITRNKCDLFRKQIDTAHLYAVNQLCKNDGRLLKDTKSSQLIYDLLLSDIGTLNYNLTIVPDAWLNYINVEALFKELIAGKPDYLIYHHSVNYKFSLATLEYPEMEKGIKTDFVGFAPIFKNATDYAYLPHSAEEVRAAANYFKQSKRFLGSEASFANFKTWAGDCQFLHINTHGGADSSSFENAWIALTDTLLYVSDLAGNLISADLVVVNGCETAGGQMHKGEGVLSIARSFKCAGAKNIIASLWKVNNMSSTAIVAGFYQYLDQGKSETAALRQAKLDYIADENTSQLNANPQYWASLVFFGENSVNEPAKSFFSTALAIRLSILVLALLALVLVSIKVCRPQS